MMIVSLRDLHFLRGKLEKPTWKSDVEMSIHARPTVFAGPVIILIR